MDKRKALIDLLSTLKSQARPSRVPKQTYLVDVKYDSLLYILDEVIDQLDDDRRRESDLNYEFEEMEQLIDKMKGRLDSCKYVLNENHASLS